MQGPDELGDDSAGTQQQPHGSWQIRRSENGLGEIITPA
jgi:hypothetical protein